MNDEPIVYQVHPTDEGEPEWWLAESSDELVMPEWCHERRAPPPSLTASAWQAYLDQPREPSPEWWAGCLEGFRLGLALAPQAGAGAPPGARAKPTVPGARTR